MCSSTHLIRDHVSAQTPISICPVPFRSLLNNGTRCIGVALDKVTEYPCESIVARARERARLCLQLELGEIYSRIKCSGTLAKRSTNESSTRRSTGSDTSSFRDSITERCILLIAREWLLINSELARETRIATREEFLRRPTSGRRGIFIFSRRRGANATAEDKGNEVRVSVRQVLKAPNENEIVRGPRHAKTTCLMVSLVRKKGKHGRGEKWSFF